MGEPYAKPTAFATSPLPESGEPGENMRPFGAQLE